MTELTWRHGPIRVLATDFVAMGDCLPRTAGGTESPGQYIKRFRVVNDGPEPTEAVFGVYVQAEVNGGIGEPGLSWHDQDRTLLAINRGHGHVNRKLARDATVEFALALDDRGEVQCEPTGPNEAILLRKLELPAGGSVSVDLLVSGAFTGWRGDPGTFEHWLRPALTWFRSADLDAVEQATAQEWDAFIEPLPGPHFPKPTYAVSLRRSALAAALHADEQWGAIASGFDRGLSAYCWPREALWAGGAMDRAGHPEIGRKVFQWLAAVKGQTHAYAYWFQKYTIDGQPEWETPAIDQTAMIPWAVERHYRRTGDLDFVAVLLADRRAGRRGLRRDLGPSRAPLGRGPQPDQLGGDLGQPVRGLPLLQRRGRRRPAGRGPAGPAARPRGAGRALGASGPTGSGRSGILGRVGRRRRRARDGRPRDRPVPRRPAALDAPGLVDRPARPDQSSGRRRWTSACSAWSSRSGCCPAADPRVRATAEAIFRHNAIAGDANFFARWSGEPAQPGRERARRARATPTTSPAWPRSGWPAT